jgi:hypothetical protein
MPRTSVITLGFMAGLAISTGVAAPAGGPANPTSPPIAVFHPFQVLAKHAGRGGHFTMDNGTPVSGADWATLIIAGFPDLLDVNGYPTYCTATFVGPTVIVTAAHCVFDTKTEKPSAAEMAIDGWPDPIVLNCLVDRRYAGGGGGEPDANYDYSLCHLDIPQAAPDIPTLLGISRFDSLELAKTYSSGSAVVMTGYGCTNERIEDSQWKRDDADGWLRVGDALLNAVPHGNGTGRNAYTVVSHGTMPTLCPGDSGGPMLVGIDARHPVPYRRIVALNQSVTRLTDEGRDFSSAMIGVDTADFNDFLVDTYNKAFPGDKICGQPNAPAGQGECR